MRINCQLVGYLVFCLPISRRKKNISRQSQRYLDSLVLSVPLMDDLVICYYGDYLVIGLFGYYDYYLDTWLTGYLVTKVITWLFGC